MSRQEEQARSLLKKLADSAENENQLINLAKAGNVFARQRLYSDNRRSILRCIRRRSDVPGSDLEQAASLAFFKAVQDFKPEKGHALMAYARPFIVKAVMEVRYAHTSAVRMPTYMHSRLNRIQNAENELRSAGFEPSSENIAPLVGLSAEEVDSALTLRGLRDSGSIDELTDEFGQEFVPGDAAKQTEAVVEDEELNACLRAELAMLTARQREIVVLRFGLEAGNGKSLEEVGAVLGISKQTVAEHEEIALRKLKKNAPWLKDFLASRACETGYFE